MLDAVDSAIMRLVAGAKMITLNNQTFHFTQLDELRRMRKELRLEVAEESGTDGRGAWEAIFSD